ncbi:MAG: DUF1700 domain-containing protein [Lachnospiraceae bacterium]
MDCVMNDYLSKIEKYLKSMSTSERVDIIKEIKSQMLELEAAKGLSSDQIVDRMGNPKDLAKAYLGESISKNNSFSWRKLGSVFAFYSLASMGSLFVLPVISTLSVGLMLCSIIAPIGGLIKFVGYLFGYDVPFVLFQFGSFTAHPLLAFPLSIIFGLLLFFVGRKLWNLTMKLIRTISIRKRSLQDL